MMMVVFSGTNNQCDQAYHKSKGKNPKKSDAPGEPANQIAVRAAKTNRASAGKMGKE
jgi:hypothetical protein